MDDSKCVGAKPSTPPPKDCDAGVCPEVHTWKTIPGTCDKQCGGG